MPGGIANSKECRIFAASKQKQLNRNRLRKPPMTNMKSIVELDDALINDENFRDFLEEREIEITTNEDMEYEIQDEDLEVLIEQFSHTGYINKKNQ